MLTDPLPAWRLFVPIAGFLALALLCVIRPMPLLRTVLLTSCCLMVYAALQDQFSAHTCPEYFTVGHPPVPGLKHPVLLGLTWGFLGGFPGGIALGIPLALAAHIGKAPAYPIRSLFKPLLCVLLFMAVTTTICAATAVYNSGVVNISIGSPWKEAVPVEQHRAFFIVACAHFGTYLSALVGGLALCGWVWRQRAKVNTAPPLAQTGTD